MRVLILAGALVLAGAAVSVACSSASPATATADAGTPAKSGDDDDSTSTTTSSSSSSSSSGAVATTDAGDDDAEAGTVATTDGGLVQGTDAGALCDPDAFGEVEPNNTAPGNELPVTGTGTFKFCGFVINGDPDFVSFTVPTFQSASVQFAGLPASDVSGTIGTQTFQDGQIPHSGVNPGDVWTTQILTDSTTGHAYQITFTFQ